MPSCSPTSAAAQNRTLSIPHHHLTLGCFQEFDANYHHSNLKTVFDPLTDVSTETSCEQPRNYCKFSLDDSPCNCDPLDQSLHSPTNRYRKGPPIPGTSIVTSLFTMRKRNRHAQTFHVSVTNASTPQASERFPKPQFAFPTTMHEVLAARYSNSNASRYLNSPRWGSKTRYLCAWTQRPGS